MSEIKSYLGPRSVLTYLVDNNVPLPRSKAGKRDDKRRKKAFEGYAKAYAAVHVQQPTHYVMTASGNMRIEPLGLCASVKRVEQLTRMLRERLATR